MLFLLDRFDCERLFSNFLLSFLELLVSVALEDLASRFLLSFLNSSGFFSAYSLLATCLEGLLFSFRAVSLRCEVLVDLLDESPCAVPVRLLDDCPSILVVFGDEQDLCLVRIPLSVVEHSRRFRLDPRLTDVDSESFRASSSAILAVGLASGALMSLFCSSTCCIPIRTFPASI